MDIDTPTHKSSFKETELIEKMQVTLGGIILEEAPVPETSSKRSMTGQSSKQKKSRQDEMEVIEPTEYKAPRPKPTESANLNTLNTSQHYKRDISVYIKSYFNILSNLIERSSAKLTDFYFKESMLTVSKLSGMKEMKSEDAIYGFFQTICHMRKYNISSFHIQPSIGQGAFVVAKGTMGTTFEPVIHKISMSFQIIRLRKKYYILNQVFDIE